MFGWNEFGGLNVGPFALYSDDSHKAMLAEKALQRARKKSIDRERKLENQRQTHPGKDPLKYSEMQPFHGHNAEMTTQEFDAYRLAAQTGNDMFGLRGALANAHTAKPPEAGGMTSGELGDFGTLAWAGNSFADNPFLKSLMDANAKASSSSGRNPWEYLTAHAAYMNAKNNATDNVRQGEDAITQLLDGSPEAQEMARQTYEQGALPGINALTGGGVPGQGGAGSTSSFVKMPDGRIVWKQGGGASAVATPTTPAPSSPSVAPLSSAQDSLDKAGSPDLGIASAPDSAPVVTKSQSGGGGTWSSAVKSVVGDILNSQSTPSPRRVVDPMAGQLGGQQRKQSRTAEHADEVLRIVNTAVAEDLPQAEVDKRILRYLDKLDPDERNRVLDELDKREGQ